MFKGNNRVHPWNTGRPMESILKKESGFKKWTRVMSSAISFPLGYLWIPVSCCIIMPTVRYAHPTMIRGLERKDTTDTTNVETKVAQTFAANLSGMLMGCMTASTMCCCCGCACTQSPDEIYDDC